MRFGISDFGTSHFQKILSVPKNYNLLEFSKFFIELIPNREIEIKFFDLNGNEVDQEIKLDELPENNDLFIQIDVDVGLNNPDFEKQFNRY